MSSKSVQITNTGTLSNCEITDYHGVINSQMVFGMNVFKDFLSGWTDFFGGKSTSYNKTIDKLYSVVQSEMQQKAHSLGANYILNYQIDLEEITGQGKSMIMLTAIGTAVTAKFPDKKPSDKKTADWQDIQLLSDRKHIITRISTYSQITSMSDADWEFIFHHSVDEVAEYVLEMYLKSFDKTLYRDKIISYFNSIKRQKAVKVLYPVLKENPSIKDIIKECKLWDFDEIKKLTENSSEIALELVTNHKDSYTHHDSLQFKLLKDLLLKQFPDISNQTKKKKTFGGEVLGWECGNCNHINDLDIKHCSKCTKDKRGISPNLDFQKILTDIDERIETLKSFFNS